MLAVALFAAMLVSHADSVAPNACPSSSPSSSRKPAGIEAFVVLAPQKVQPRDSLVRATVCIARPSASKRIGSYHGELTFDSTLARVASVVKPAGGMRVENTTLAGRVKFAGADPAGFGEDALLTVVLHVRGANAIRARDTIRLKMLELNAVDGTDLMKQLATTPGTAKP